MNPRSSNAGNLSTREWEALSAYLDDKLGSKEKAALELRLEDNLDLQALLEDLRRTRSLLQSQPRKRAPRNFTLTPAMAGIYPDARSLSNAFPALRLASVLATIFFVLITVSQLIYAGNRAANVVQPEYMQVATSEAEVEMYSEPSFGVGGGSGSGNETEASPAEAPLALAPEQPTQVAMEKLVEEPPQATPEAGVLVVTPLGVQPTIPSVALDEADQVATVTEEIKPQLSVAEEVAPPLREHQEVTAMSRGWTLLNVVQAFLATLAVGTGLAALWLWHTRRR